MSKDECSAPEGGNLHPVFAKILQGMFDPERADAELRAAQTPVMTMVEQRKLFALQAAYEKALVDVHARIPTYLHGAIEALK